MNAFARFRNSAHTGDHRCVPCTVVNLGILWAIVNAVVILSSLFVGGAVFVIGLAVIWLRGYLVPFTPRFAPKLVAATPIPSEWFHDTTEAGALSSDTEDGEQLIAELSRAGIIEADERQVYLDQTFETEWHEEMDRLASLSLSDLAAEIGALSTMPTARPLEEGGQEWIVLDGQNSLVPRHVAVAELGAVRALEGVIDDPATRLAMARPLREFLTDCPVCGSAFVESNEVSCCGGHTNPREKPRATLVCPECEQRFLLLPDTDGV